MSFTPTTRLLLVETLVAITVLLTALIGPMTIAISSIRTAYYVEEETTALYLAQEGVEVVQAYRNSHLIESLSNGNFRYLGLDDRFGP